MVTELKDISDPVTATKRIAKYTECFDLLDRLGADNCIDPEDFDNEDLNDDMFKNLQISDIDEMFKDDEDLPLQTPVPETPGQVELNDNPKKDLKEQDEDALDTAFVDVITVDIEYDQLDHDHLLHNDQDSDIKSEEGEEEDLQFMDFEEQLKLYEQM